MSPLWGNVITALGVLAGASLTGGLALLKGRQDAKEKEADRAEARRVRLLEHRREAYAAFLSQARLVTTSMSAAVSMETPVEETEWTTACNELDEAVTGLYDVYVELALAGPPSIADQGERLWLLAYRAQRQIEGLSDRADGAAAGRTLDIFLTDEDPERMHDFIDQQKAFIMLTRKQLGADHEEA